MEPLILVRHDQVQNDCKLISRGPIRSRPAMLARSTGSSNQSGLADDSLARTAPSNTTERQSPLCGLVRRYLLLAQVSASEWSRNENALLMLSESILGSALAPSPAMTTEAAVVEVLKKRLAHGGADGMDRAIKFSEILVRLQNTVFPQIKLPQSRWYSLRAIDYGACCTFCCELPRRMGGQAQLQGWLIFSVVVPSPPKP